VTLGRLLIGVLEWVLYGATFLCCFLGSAGWLISVVVTFVFRLLIAAMEGRLGERLRALRRS
jgi:hypothetical protein